jgi:hypothetical protein
MMEAIVEQIVQNFGTISEQQICELEFQVATKNPGSLERHLLYALRVSKCVHNLRKLDTLVSRWGVAHCGAGGMGLDAAKTSPQWAMVAAFLTKLYDGKFAELVKETVTTTIDVASKRKNNTAKQKALDKGIGTLRAAVKGLSADYPALDNEVKPYLAKIEQFRNSIHGPAGEKLGRVVQAERRP